MIALGTRMGSYQITSLLGQGGMGEVYRATDPKLNRDVALKFLPEQFTADPGRLERFQREAYVLAPLNHSNVASIYGFEDSASLRALVMELVEMNRQYKWHRRSILDRISYRGPYVGGRCRRLRCHDRSRGYFA